MQFLFEQMHLNTKKNTMYHEKADEFIHKLKGKYKGILFDPPYSIRQTKECYENIGLKFKS
jgi:adenine-specific DNA methylase